MSFVRQRLGSDLGHQHPVLSGFAALAAVTVTIALVLALATIFGARLLGLSGGGGGGGGQPGAGPTLYVPDPEPTEPAEDESASGGESGTPSGGASVVPPAEPAASETTQAPPIVLAADPARVGSFERINLTGQYPSGNGSILQVQRKEGGRWVDFSVTASVQGGDFTTYVQTSRAGLNLWRMKDTDSGALSNVVRVQVG